MRKARDWLLVFVDPTASNPSTYQIVAEGSEPRIRPLKNEFRGAALKTVVALVRECEAKKQIQREDNVPSDAREALGPVAVAYPILNADSTEVAAVQIWAGSMDGDLPNRPLVGTWEWLTDADTADPAPPQLLMDVAALDLVGVEKEHRDRTVFGPADLYTRSARLSDSLRHIRTLRGMPATLTADASPIEGSDFFISRGEVSQQLHYSERAVGDRRVRGLCWVGSTPRQRVRESMLDSWLCTLLAAASDMYVGVGDTSYKYPYFVKWVTDHIPGLGHGVSTGGTFAIHEEDLPNVIRWISEIQKGNQVGGEVRARKGGGGYLKAKFTALPLDPDVNPKIGLVLIQPDVKTIDG